MRYYIIDDNIAVVKVLENIIRVRGLGEIVGSSTDAELAVKEILRIRPDIVLVDLLMSGIDGITLVADVRTEAPDISFVMISKVSDKKMIQSAYEAGVEFFIQKPISVIEVERILTGLEEKIKMRKIVSSIRDLFPAGEEVGGEQETVVVDTNRINVFLGMLGMLGEKGAKDIQMMAELMIRTEKPFDRKILEQTAEEQGDSVKNIEQRARRAIKKGLTNTANAALDDYAGNIVDVYAGYVFDFKALKDEMNAIEGKGNTAGGRISLSRFMDGLIAYYNNVK
ncbi:MAG: DNA-binding domain-containing protein [Firmicutes bacterium]|nr:DNA-binding domain-containing protein [Bacillota bacterium]